MAMEKTGIASPAPQGAHEARPVRGSGGKLAGAQDAAQTGSQGGGFASLLAALGDGADAQAGAAAPLLDAVGATASDASEETLKTQPGVPDAAALAPWMPGLQPTVAQAQGAGAAMEGARAATEGAGAATGGAAGVLMGMAGRGGQGLMAAVQDGLLRLAPGSLVGETATLDGATEAAALSGMPQGMGAAAPAGRGAAARAQPWQPADAAQGAVGPGRGHAMAAAVHAPAGMEPATPPAAQAAGAASGERRDALQAMPLAQPRGGEAEAVAPALAATAAHERQPGAAQAEARASDGAAPAGGGEQQAPEAQPAAADAAPAGMAGAEDQLAEQVADQASYWVHHKTQNAELTLDQDGRPVEVRVALTGDQAHVSLRSDQPEARQLLDAGRDQLQDMLQRQGLQLAGMTVGAGGGNGPGARQDGREAGRQGAQRASVQAALPTGQAARGHGVGEHSVDIFV